MGFFMKAFVGYPGSGNSWIRFEYITIKWKATNVFRFMIGFATGINSCADRVEMHEDGEAAVDNLWNIFEYFIDGCLITLTHHLLMMHNNRSRWDHEKAFMKNVDKWEIFQNFNIKLCY